MSFRLKYLCMSILNAILATALVIKLSVYPEKILQAILLVGVILGSNVFLSNIPERLHSLQLLSAITASSLLLFCLLIL